MIILYIAFAVVFGRALIGWEIKVSKSRSLTKGQARFAAAACLPIFGLADERGLLGPCILIYLVAFSLLSVAIALVAPRRV
jgi:hypothetical protein